MNFGDDAGSFNKGSDGIAAAADFGQFESRGGEEIFEETGSASGAGAVHHVEEGTGPDVGGGLEDFEVPQGRGIEKKAPVAGILADRPEVFRFGAEIFGNVVDQGAGGAESGMEKGEAETVEIEDTEGFEDAFGAGLLLELEGGEFGDETVAEEVEEFLHDGDFVFLAAPNGQALLGNDDFLRIDGGEDREEVFNMFFGGENEFAGGEVHPGGADLGSVEIESEDVAVFFGLDLAGFDGGAGGDDAGEGAFDQFPGLGGFNLFAEGDFLPGGEDFGDVALGGVVRDAGHRVIVAAGQGDAEDAGSENGIFVKQLVEITQAEEEEGVGRQVFPYRHVLLHHRGQFGFLRHGDEDSGIVRRIEEKGGKECRRLGMYASTENGSDFVGVDSGKVKRFVNL